MLLNVTDFNVKINSVESVLTSRGSIVSTKQFCRRKKQDTIKYRSIYFGVFQRCFFQARNCKNNRLTKSHGRVSKRLQGTFVVRLQDIKGKK